MVSGQLDYSDPEVQRDMEELVQALENTTYIDPAYTESWLRSFMDYVTRWSVYPGGPELRVDSEQSFISTLRDVSTTAIHDSYSDVWLSAFILTVISLDRVCQKHVDN